MIWKTEWWEISSSLTWEILVAEKDKILSGVVQSNDDGENTMLLRINGVLN